MLDKKARDELLAKIPEDAKRVQVRTKKGNLKYKDVSDVIDSDEIQVNQRGFPIVMMRKPGRKEETPSSDDSIDPDTRARLRRKQKILDIDPVLKEICDNPESPDVLQEIIKALGGESASIYFERTEAERRGKEGSGYSVKRIQALRTMADTWLKRKDQIQARGVDMDTPAFNVLFNFIMETVQKGLVMSDIRAERIETAFAHISKMIGEEEWENEAKRRMKSII